MAILGVIGFSTNTLLLPTWGIENIDYFILRLELFSKNLDNADELKGFWGRIVKQSERESFMSDHSS